MSSSSNKLKKTIRKQPKGHAEDQEVLVRHLGANSSFPSRSCSFEPKVGFDAVLTPQEQSRSWPQRKDSLGSRQQLSDQIESPTGQTMDGPPDEEITLSQATQMPVRMRQATEVNLSPTSPARSLGPEINLSSEDSPSSPVFGIVSQPPRMMPMPKLQTTAKIPKRRSKLEGSLVIDTSVYPNDRQISISPRDEYKRFPGKLEDIDENAVLETPTSPSDREYSPPYSAPARIVVPKTARSRKKYHHTSGIGGLIKATLQQQEGHWLAEEKRKTIGKDKGKGKSQAPCEIETVEYDEDIDMALMKQAIMDDSEILSAARHAMATVVAMANAIDALDMDGQYLKANGSGTLSRDAADNVNTLISLIPAVQRFDIKAERAHWEPLVNSAEADAQELGLKGLETCPVDFKDGHVQLRILESLLRPAEDHLGVLPDAD